MKNVTQNFKENIKKYGRQLNSVITIDNDVKIDSENINNINFSFNSDLFKSVMHVLEIDSNIKIEKGSIIDVKAGVKFNDSEYDYIEYKQYKVTEEPEKQEDTLSYKIFAYDKMVESMVDYDLTITERITLREYLIKICERLGWNTNNIPASFVNSEKNVSPALHQGIGYTFRDVLDEIATLSCSFLFFIGDNFYLKYVTETNEIIDEESLSETDVTIGEEYFINSLVFARAEESDNIYRNDEESIKENGVHEFRVADNQLLSTNDRVDYIDDMFGYLSLFKFYIYDIKSTGIMFLDIADRFTLNIHEQLYSTIMLNNEINITQGLEERMYVDKPEESETEYKYADITDKKINQTYIIVDKQNQVIESVVSNVTAQNNKIARVEQTVDSLNSKISDIADITTSQETATGKLIFEKINQSEPIHIEIRPLGENISYLYPFEKLFPADDLFIKLRTLRFTNTQTNEVFDYELPDDLLYYDSENYDEFILDYDSLTCYINKKCAYNDDGDVILLDSEIVNQYDFPHIELTDGDYTIGILKYDEVPYGAYLFARLMAQNIYTTQFATKAEVNSEISQTVDEIGLNVDKKLTNYATTTQMNSAINVKANEITSSVSETYETKANATTNYSKLTQTANSLQSQISANDKDISTLTQTATSLQSQINSNDKDISTLNQTATNISSTVSKKVGYNEIISSINQSAETVTIDADKISLNGKEIDLTSDNTTIASNNFNVDKNGNVECSNIDITGGKIHLTDISGVGDEFQISNDNYIIKIGASLFNMKENDIYSNAGIFCTTSEYGEPTIQVSNDTDQYTFVQGSGISTPTLTQTSLEANKKNIETLENAIDIIKEIDIYRYNLKGEDDTVKKHIGFVIGDNYKYSKEVTSNKNDGADIYSFVSLCCQAIKEQQAKIEELEKRLEENANGKD